MPSHVRFPLGSIVATPALWRRATSMGCFEVLFQRTVVLAETAAEAREQKRPQKLEDALECTLTELDHPGAPIHRLADDGVAHVTDLCAGHQARNRAPVPTGPDVTSRTSFLAAPGHQAL